MALAFASYETPFAPCGGIAAVMSRLPLHVARLANQTVFVFSPFHHKSARMGALATRVVGETFVSLDGATLPVAIHRYDDPQEPRLAWIFLQVADERIFGGQAHPYAVWHGDLLRDALFFGAATARSLAIVAPHEPFTLLLQDWEAATVALALPEQPVKHRAFLTLHNTYDSRCFPQDLRRAGIRPEHSPPLRQSTATAPAVSGPGVRATDEAEASILQRALGVVEPRVFTVSEQFALDITSDILQTHIMVPHLKDLLKPRLRGIDNGPFVDLAVPPDLVTQAALGGGAELLQWKAQQRQSFLAALAQFQPTADKPLWGDVARFAAAEGPWFVMAGRDDCRQKGYDVAAAAVEEFLGSGGIAQFLFFPIPGDEGLHGLSFLAQLANRFSDRVLIVPFIFREGFLPALRGAHFALMPSLYEPFGMSNEFYLNGTVGISRATGGSVQQIVPLRSAACFSRAVLERAERWHASSTRPTGLLFREPDQIPSAAHDWGAFNAAAYQARGQSRVEERRQYPLFRSMAWELRLAIHDALRILHDQPAQYAQMLASGIAHIQSGFSWPRAAAEYLRAIA